MTKKPHSKELKFKVAVEAIKGDLTIAQIMSQYGVAESLVHKCRKQLLDQGSHVFAPPGMEASSQQHEKQIKTCKPRSGNSR